MAEDQEVKIEEEKSQYGELSGAGELEEYVDDNEEPEELGELVVGLDIGTTKVCCVIAEIREDEVVVLGVGLAPSLGLKKGVVVNIESTVKSVVEAVDQAEEDAGVDLDGVEVYVGIAGDHIRGFNSPGIISVEREIRHEDMAAVIDAAAKVKISENEDPIHVMAQEFMVDDHTGIQNPVGMFGVRLATNVHIVTADKSAAHNLATCCRQANLELDHLVLESIASSHAVLSEDERELGVALIDIGGGTTDLAVFSDGTLRHTFETGLGGHNLTNDVSVSMRTPLQDAERLKEDFGSAISSAIKPNKMVSVPTVGDREPRQATQKMLVEILEARMVEILEIMNVELVSSGMKSKINGGIVITGGTALLSNLVQLAEQIFGMPVRIGFPLGLTGKSDKLQNPRCTTAAGLVLYAETQLRNRSRIVEREGFFKQLKRWLSSWL